VRILYSSLGVLLISAAAGVYAVGPKVDFVNTLSVTRFVNVATPTLAILGMVLIVMAIALPERNKGIPQS
jgi:predicted PurR-regulated permease PerM